MKKKITVLCLVAVLAITAIAGASLAYFTSETEVENTFTAGGVKIELIEQQVNDEGTALEPFEQGQALMPIVGSAQGDKNSFGQPVAENYIDKIVTIENTGKSDAYVRAYFAIPSALDDGFEEGFNASLNILHFNFGNEDGVSTHNNQWLWGSEAKPEHSGWNYFETTIDGIAYNVYYADYYRVLKAGETTEQFVSGVYLDQNVDMNEDDQYTITRDDEEIVIEGFDGSAVCPVFAVAVQAAGFDSAAEAVTAAFGANFDPWNR